MSIFGDIIAATLAANREVAGEQVTFRHSGIAIVIPDAKPAGNERIEQRDMQAILQMEEVEWRIGRERLASIGLPRKGMTIEWQVHGETLTYAIQPPSGGNQCWGWTDHGQTEFRVFTKLVNRD